MPLDIAQVTVAELATVTIALPKVSPTASVTVTYDPAKYNLHAERYLTRQMSREPYQASAAFLLQILVSWDITENGEPVPVSEESLAKLDFEMILSPLIDGIMDDVVAGLGKRMRSDSSAPSSTATPPRRRSPAKGASRARR